MASSAGRIPDAIVAAAAERAGCEQIITFDGPVRLDDRSGPSALSDLDR